MPLPTPTIQSSPAADRPSRTAAGPGGRRGFARGFTRGFTVVEVLTVITIIAVLAGILVVAFGSVGGNANKTQTRTQLERMKNVMSETLGNKAAADKFFQIQYVVTYGGPQRTWAFVPASSTDSLDATAEIVNRLLANPAGKKIFDDMPTERKRSHTGKDSQGRTLTGMLPLDAWGNPILFVFDNWLENTSGTPTPKIGPSNQPVGGLTEVYSDASKSYWECATTSNRPKVTDAATYAYENVFVKAAKPRKGYALNNGDAIRAPDRQPFWVSAGADGKFETHDDNLYSFEN